MSTFRVGLLVAEFNVLIVESVFHRRFVVVGIVSKNYTRFIQEFAWKEELYGHWEFMDVLTYAIAKSPVPRRGLVSTQ